jgi:hypothetical protein
VFDFPATRGAVRLLLLDDFEIISMLGKYVLRGIRPSPTAGTALLWRCPADAAMRFCCRVDFFIFAQTAPRSPALIPEIPRADVRFTLTSDRARRAQRAVCKNPGMAKRTHSASDPQKSHPSYYPVIINFSDDSSEWYKQIASAIHAAPPEIRVQFCGGSEVVAFDLICLRNCLLDIPTSIRLVTVAMGSLPAFACVPWLVGEERHIAREARVWIPELPEELLRHGTKGRRSKPVPMPPTESESEEEELDKIFGITPSHEASAKTRRRSANPRRETDMRILADMANEWFPCWEFAGKSLRFDHLLEWGVVKPEWAIGSSRAAVRCTIPDSANAAEPVASNPHTPPTAADNPKKRRKPEARES